MSGLDGVGIMIAGIADVNYHCNLVIKFLTKKVPVHECPREIAHNETFLFPFFPPSFFGIFGI